MNASTILLLERLALIGLAGAVGAVARYLLSRFIMIQTGGSFPWGTLVVNISGCLLFGYILGLSEYKGMLSDKTRVMLLIGFIGSFTTFSSFAYESVVLFREHHWWVAAVNVVTQNVLGILSLIAGMAASRW